MKFELLNTGPQTYVCVWWDVTMPVLLHHIEFSAPATVKKLTFGKREAVFHRPATARTLTPKHPKLIVPGQRFELHFEVPFQGVALVEYSAPQAGILPE
jgi:hypothetical protein